MVNVIQLSYPGFKVIAVKGMYVNIFIFFKLRAKERERERLRECTCMRVGGWGWSIRPWGRDSRVGGLPILPAGVFASATFQSSPRNPFP